MGYIYVAGATEVKVFFRGRRCVSMLVDVCETINNVCVVCS